MTERRYAELMSGTELELGTVEVYEGWHWCSEWDGLLVGPGMPEWNLGEVGRQSSACCCGYSCPKLTNY